LVSSTRPRNVGGGKPKTPHFYRFECDFTKCPGSPHRSPRRSNWPSHARLPAPPWLRDELMALSLMSFCPVPHTTRDQAWLAIGATIGAGIAWCSWPKRRPPQPAAAAAAAAATAAAAAAAAATAAAAAATASMRGALRSPPTAGPVTAAACSRLRIRPAAPQDAVSALPAVCCTDDPRL
jgi:hypothetical protein